MEIINKELELKPGSIVIEDKRIKAADAYALLFEHKGGLLASRATRSGSLAAENGRAIALIEKLEIEKIQQYSPLTYRLFSYSENKDIVAGSVVYLTKKKTEELLTKPNK